MRLTKLKIAGFKSFVDPTTVTNHSQGESGPWDIPPTDSAVLNFTEFSVCGFDNFVANPFIPVYDEANSDPYRGLGCRCIPTNMVRGRGQRHRWPPAQGGDAGLPVPARPAAGLGPTGPVHRARGPGRAPPRSRRTTPAGRADARGETGMRGGAAQGLSPDPGSRAGPGRACDGAQPNPDPG